MSFVHPRGMGLLIPNWRWRIMPLLYNCNPEADNDLSFQNFSGLNNSFKATILVVPCSLQRRTARTCSGQSGRLPLLHTRLWGTLGPSLVWSGYRDNPAWFFRLPLTYQEWALAAAEGIDRQFGQRTKREKQMRGWIWSQTVVSSSTVVRKYYRLVSTGSCTIDGHYNKFFDKALSSFPL